MSSTMSIVPFLQKVDDAILNPLILLLFALAFVYFAYGVVKFLNPSTAEKDRIEARVAMLWGIVGMAIMFSVYGLIGFVLSTFQVGNGTKIDSKNVLTPCTYVTQTGTTQPGTTQTTPCQQPGQ